MLARSIKALVLWSLASCLPAQIGQDLNLSPLNGSPLFSMNSSTVNTSAELVHVTSTVSLAPGIVYELAVGSSVLSRPATDAPTAVLRRMRRQPSARMADGPSRCGELPNTTSPSRAPSPWCR
ncbi:MAG: hypothetical protein U1F36_00065 [Planctomycetota bacterium]